MDVRGAKHLYFATDLTNFVACRHLTVLERLAAHQLAKRPFYDDPMLEILRERGLAHEEEYVRRFARAGKRVVEKASPVNLASYTGRYFSEELETFYDLSVEGGQLVIRHRRFGPVALTRTSEDTFSATLPVSKIVFRRDAQGGVTGFEAGNGRARDITFKKVGH